MSNIAIITVEGIDFLCISHDISKFEGNKCFSEHSVLDDCEYM